MPNTYYLKTKNASIKQKHNDNLNVGYVLGMTLRNRVKTFTSSLEQFACTLVGECIPVSSTPTSLCVYGIH